MNNEKQALEALRTETAEKITVAEQGIAKARKAIARHARIVLREVEVEEHTSLIDLRAALDRLEAEFGMLHRADALRTARRNLRDALDASREAPGEAVDAEPEPAPGSAYAVDAAGEEITPVEIKAFARKGNPSTMTEVEFEAVASKVCVIRRKAVPKGFEYYGILPDGDAILIRRSAVRYSGAIVYAGPYAAGNKTGLSAMVQFSGSVNIQPGNGYCPKFKARKTFAIKG